MRRLSGVLGSYCRAGLEPMKRPGPTHKTENGAYTFNNNKNPLMFFTLKLSVYYINSLLQYTKHQVSIKKVKSDKQKVIISMSLNI